MKGTEFYEHYIDNAKDVLKKAKRIEKMWKGTTEKGDKYVGIHYIPRLTSHEFEGGEFIRAVQFFYKDDEHLTNIMKELNLPMNLLN